MAITTSTTARSAVDWTFEELWAPGTPAEEWAFGSKIGREDALCCAEDRAKFLYLLAGLEKGTLEFVKRLRATSLIAQGNLAGKPLPEFISDLFGPLSGGIYGPYAQGYVREFERHQPSV